MITIDRRHFLAAAPVALSPALLADAAKKTSPFLQGHYSPVAKELTAGDLKVIGKLPPEMDGLFVRNGPNPQFPPKGPYHWFDGDGMLHGVRVRDGKASYRNRYVRTEGWKEESKAGKALYGGLMSLPDLKKAMAGQEGHKNTANTAVVWYNGRLLALWEGGAPHEVKAPSLETVGRYTFGGRLKHACTAHPKIDPVTGEFLFFGYQPVRPYLRYSVADARGVIKRTVAIDLPRPVMMHDFAVTAKHTLFLDLPVAFSLTAMLRGRSPFAYDPKLPARIGVMPRHGKANEVKWFDIKSCYVFHTLNAYDDGDEVVLLAGRMRGFPDEITPPEAMSDAEVRATGSSLYRWRLNLKTGGVKEGSVDDLFADFPRVNEAHTGRLTRYGYMTTLRWDALVKYDLEKASRQRHELGKGRLGGEGVFVPRPGGKGEDDGWLVSYVHDLAAKRSEMLVIDARDLTSRPLARVLLPGRVPAGFHGTWVPGAALGKG